MKILKGITVFSFAWAGIYLLGSWLLGFTEVSYREWVTLFGKVTLAWILPLLALIWLGIFGKRFKLDIVWKVMAMAAMACLYLCWLWVSFWGILFTTHGEERLTSKLLVCNEGGFPQEDHFVFYRPMAFFFKVPGELTAADKADYLKKKYGKDFEAGLGGQIFDREFPGLLISVNFSAGELQDDYVENMAVLYLREAMEKLGINRESYVDGKPKGFYLRLLGKEDLESYARDASELISYVCTHTDLFSEHTGQLYFYQGVGEERIVGSIPFGKLGVWAGEETEFYLYPEKLESYVAGEYERKEAYRRQQQEESEGESKEREPENAVVREPEEVLAEKAAKAVYDAVLAEQGYGCEVCYNAKGNLYLDLGSGPEEEGSCNFTLVYDGLSKNGACQLFVLYREEATGNTSIVDMYAVETGTWKVVSGDRKAWSDLGNEAYRRITEE